MTSTPIELGTLLDGWAASARVSVVETAPAVTVSRLDAASTQELLAATHRLGWDCDVQDQAGEPALTEDIEEALGPFVATIQKAIDGADRRLLTRIGLSQALAENAGGVRSEEHTSELQSLMRISYAVFCLKKTNTTLTQQQQTQHT